MAKSKNSLGLWMVVLAIGIALRFAKKQTLSTQSVFQFGGKQIIYDYGGLSITIIIVSLVALVVTYLYYKNKRR